MKVIEQCKIISNTSIADGVYNMELFSSEIAKNANAGQFINVYLNSEKNLLPRPISICEVKDNLLRIVYGVVGEGTKKLSLYKNGDILKIMGSLGNGFSFPNEPESKKHIVIGGGIGVPPMLEVVKRLKGEVSVYLGFRNEIFLLDDFRKYCKNVFVATDNGIKGTKGNVIDLLESNNATGDVIYACGPKAMLSAVTDYGKKKNIQTQISLEERMACGFGVCVGCVVKIKDSNDFAYKKVCNDGPVFDAGEVIFND